MKINGWHALDEHAYKGRLGLVHPVTRDDGVIYALKILREDRRDSDPETIQNEARLLRESKVPDVMPALIEEGEDQGLPYIVEEWLDCIDYPIPAKDFRNFSVLAFESLARLHDVGIVHCDITPLHIRWRNGCIVFIDYDNACVLEKGECRQEQGKSVGTPPYIAPEVASAGLFTEACDVFSLAYILNERCPDELRECFGPVLFDAINRPWNERPKARHLAERLRTCRPPHHRFKAVAKWTGVVVAAFLAVLGLASLYRDKMVRDRHRLNIQTESDFKTAIADYRRGDYANAVKYLTYVADCCCRRTPQACRMLSDCYRLGLGVEKDMPKSREYAERANTRYPADSRPARKE